MDKLLIDNTQLSTYIRCPEKYRLRYVECLRKSKLDERDIDKTFGDAIHQALAYHYIGKTNDECMAKFNEVMVEDLEGERLKTKKNGARLLSNYLSFYSQIDKEFEVLAVETKGVIPISNEVDYLVKIDLIIRWRDNIYFTDHKTAARIAYNYFNQFDLNSQMEGYGYYVKEKYGQCSGGIINVLQPSYTIDRARFELEDEQDARKDYDNIEYKVDKRNGEKYIIATGKFDFEFRRGIVNHTTQELEAWKQNALLWVKRLNKSVETNEWGRVTTTCPQYRGCGFKEICLTQGDEQIIETLYEKFNSKEYLEG